LPIGQACFLARQLFDALRYLAAQNIVHRDIKPSNLMVAPEHQLKLLDLGLAKVAEAAEAEDLTHAGQLIGTPAFMAPEQIVDVRNVSPAMDLYAAGMTLFMMVTGTHAFTGTHIPELLSQIVQAAPPSPRSIRPDLPQPVSDLITRLLAKSAAERPRHDEAIQILSHYAEDDRGASLHPQSTQIEQPLDAVNDTRMLGPDRVDRILNAVDSAERQLKHEDIDELLSVLPQVNGDVRLGEFFVRKRIGRRSSINTFSGEMPLGKVPCILRVFPPAFGEVATQVDALLEEQGRLMQLSMKSSHLTTLLYIGKATLARGTVRDLYYTVENHVPGTTFEEMIRAGERLGLREARRCLLQAAAGLWTLHEGQILHGNLHPAKFLYDPEAQELCICDITRARLVNEDRPPGAAAPDAAPLQEDKTAIVERADETQVWLGSGNRYWFSDCSSLRRQYIAPEILSENQAATFASEQYSLGVVFIEAMTGSFIRADADTLKLINRVRAELEDRLDDIAEESPRFAQTLRKLVKPNAASRYPDLRELRRVLLLSRRDDEEGRSRVGRTVSAPRGSVANSSAVAPRRETDRRSAGSKFDVFISYRRDGGAETSRAIKERLQREGFAVFLDVDRLKSGHFDVTLLRHIENTRNFLVVLSKNSLERAREQPNDWLRREIAHAIRCRRNVIPLMAPGFKMPNAEDLPYDLRQLVKYNGICYEHEHFDGVIEQLLEFLRSPA
jgi:serine/threonine protein kinase